MFSAAAMELVVYLLPAAFYILSLAMPRLGEQHEQRAMRAGNEQFKPREPREPRELREQRKLCEQREQRGQRQAAKREQRATRATRATRKGEQSPAGNKPFDFGAFGHLCHEAKEADVHLKWAQTGHAPACEPRPTTPPQPDLSSAPGVGAFGRCARARPLEFSQRGISPAYRADLRRLGAAPARAQRGPGPGRRLANARASQPPHRLPSKHMAPRALRARARELLRTGPMRRGV